MEKSRCSNCGESGELIFDGICKSCGALNTLEFYEEKDDDFME